MSTDARLPIAPRKLWFGFVTSAVAWVSLGCIDIVINWRACMHQEDYGIPEPHPQVRVLIGVLALALLIVAISAGVTSYRNWRALSAQSKLLGAEAVERNEYIALLGVIITVTLGMGIVWLALPPLFLDLCWRAR